LPSPIVTPLSFLTLASSGNNFDLQHSVFPELVNAVAQAIDHPPGAPLPTVLRKAISQFPDRVQTAIFYLKHQQQRQIHNLVGYLYEAIQSEWNLTVEQSSIVPMGFNE
jgi:pyruvoyl-dependent arginine decarboxylase (PvlArgDC)